MLAFQHATADVSVLLAHGARVGMKEVHFDVGQPLSYGFYH